MRETVEEMSVGKLFGKRRGAGRKAFSVLLCLALVVGCSSVPLSAFGDVAQGVASQDAAADGASSADGSAQKGTLDAQGQGRDIAAEWSAGSLELSEAGVYTLSADVETAGTLYVKAKAGETIVVDFSGHSAHVKGAAASGIDVSGSLGTVRIVDSAYKADEQDVTKAGLSVSGEKVGDALCGVYAVYAKAETGQDSANAAGDGADAANAANGADEAAAAESSAPAATPSLQVENVDISVNLDTVDAGALEGDDGAVKTHDACAVNLGYADEADARQAVDASFANATFAAHVNEQLLSEEDAAALAGKGEAALDSARAGCAYGVRTSKAGVTLKGAFSADVQSSRTAYGLYSDTASAFTMGEGLSIASDVQVYSAGNERGAAFACVDGALSDADAEAAAAKLCDATGNGRVLALEDGKLVFRSGETSGLLLPASIAPSAASEWTVVFDYNGSGQTSTTQNVADGGFVELPADPTREKYNFAGWALDADGAEPFEAESTPVTGDLTLYAV